MNGTEHRGGKPLMWLACTLALALAACFALAACGGDSDTSSSSTTAADSTEEASGGGGATGAPIKIGSVYTGSGPQAEGFAIIGKVYERWVEVTNEEGGINGHPVEIVAKSESGNAAEASRQVRELIDQDKVVAIVGNLSVTEDSWAEIPAEKNVPIVGGDWYSGAAFANPNNFPVGGSIITSYYGFMAEAKAEGLKNVSTIYCAEYPSCAVVGALFKGLAEDVVGGLKFVAGPTATSTQPSYTAPCLAVKDADGEMLYVGFSIAITRRVLEECSRQNVEATAYFSGGGIGYQDTELPGVENAVEISPSLPISATEGEGAKRLQEIIGPLMDDKEMSGSVSNPVAGLEMFKLVAELAELGPTSSSADVYKGLYQVKDETLGGLVGPITYTKGKPLNVNCYFVSKIIEASWTTESTEPVCVPPKELEEAAALLG